MKNRALITTTLGIVLLSNTVTSTTNNNLTLSSKRAPIIAVVDDFTSMGESKIGQEKRKEIEQKRDIASHEIQDQAKVFEQSKNEYISKSTTMSDAARKKSEKQLMDMKNNLDGIVAEKEEEIKTDMQVATEELSKELDFAVAEVAQKNNTDIVISQNTGRVIYVAPEWNLTKDVIEKMDKRYEIKLAQQNKQVNNNNVKVADNKVTSTRTSKVGA